MIFYLELFYKKCVIIKRDDKNSINHRISAFMASYFDIIYLFSH